MLQTSSIQSQRIFLELPDASWVSPERWSELMEVPKKGFMKLCPDFVVELRSDTDGLADLKAKMQEYLDNGAKLGWLIDPKHCRVYVYRQGRSLEQLENPSEFLGEDVVPGFVLDLRLILARSSSLLTCITLVSRWGMLIYT